MLHSFKEECMSHLQWVYDSILNSTIMFPNSSIKKYTCHTDG